MNYGNVTYDLLPYNRESATLDIVLHKPHILHVFIALELVRKYLQEGELS